MKEGKTDVFCITIFVFSSRNFEEIILDLHSERSFPSENRGLITFSNTQTRDPREKTPAAADQRREERKRMEERGGAASKLAQGRRRNPTERYKFDFIALLELMLEASTNRHHRVDGDGGRRKRTA